MSNTDMKKMMGRLKKVQSQVHDMVKDQAWVEDAKKYAERQGKELKKLLVGDAAKVKQFIEREQKVLSRFQKQIPGEVNKLKKFMLGQKKEFASVLKTLGAAQKKSAPKSAPKTAKKAAKKAPSRAKKK